MTNEQQKELAAAFQSSMIIATKGLGATEEDFARGDLIEKAFKQAATKTMIALITSGIEIDVAKFIGATIKNVDVDHVYNS